MGCRAWVSFLALECSEGPPWSRLGRVQSTWTPSHCFRAPYSDFVSFADQGWECAKLKYAPSLKASSEGYSFSVS